MKSHFFLFFAIYSFSLCFSQESRKLEWKGLEDYRYNDSLITVLDFTNSVYDPILSDNKIYFEKIPIDYQKVNFEIFDIEFINVEPNQLKNISQKELKNNISFDYYVSVEKKQNFLCFYIHPFRIKNNILQKIHKFTFKIEPLESETQNSKKISENSILATGDWYKIGVTQSGLHEINQDFLNSIGINTESINPKNIRIYGNKAGMLQEGSGEIDDLVELSIDVVGEEDNIFDDSDKILFFGESPDTWYYDGDTYIHEKNIYTDTTYYFLSSDIGPGKRIQIEENNFLGFDYHVLSYDSYLFHEEELSNLVNTGRQLFGESFSFTPYQTFNYNLDHLALSEPIEFTARVAARSSNISSFNVSNHSDDITTIYVSGLSSSNDYYRTSLVQQEFFTNSNELNIAFNYNNSGNSSALAWLDYYRLVFRNNLIFENSQFLFRDSKSIGENITSKFSITSDLNNLKVWNVTDPLNPKNLELLEENLAGVFSFITVTDTLKEFLIFNNTDNFTPHFAGIVPNQNIHGHVQPDYIIITHPKFLNPAQRLADFHINENNQSVLLVTTDQVYNEFSTGSQDISAIRNLVKMFYDRSTGLDDMPKNLLLFGDASFDFKNKLYGITNFVPTYESYASSNIHTSYCTDDYFGVLDDHEGDWNGGLNSTTQDFIDLGIGRIPASSVNEAEMFVDKVLSYNNSNSVGNWKNKICFVADDIDACWESALVQHADNLAEKIDTNYHYFNLNKIYIDSYQQSILFGSQRYPEAQKDLINLINDGVFIINYVGHGGEIGWGAERIFEVSDINNLSNNKLPVFVTATCEFTRYDDSERVSAGEYLILNPNGGAIGLYSTSRTVSESQTYSLVDRLYDYLPDRDLNLTFGESLMYAKNGPSSVKRKFSFFGDPHLKLAHPIFNINTTSIELLDSLNQVVPISLNATDDTIQALSHVRIKGNISDSNNSPVSFSGVLDLIFFDKSDTLYTLNNDVTIDCLDNPIPPFKYASQNNIIYNGKVDVINGLFECEFIVPKDISYQYGKAKLSYYASDDFLGEATGSNKNIVIGGSNSNYFIDMNGPTINLFMNDTNFVSGDYTNSNPKLLALLFDDSGINTVGTGIGHDLTVILDQNTTNQYILNEYYESDLNSYQSGKVIYPFSELSDGEHSLTFKAWDVHNNSNDAELVFFVTSSSEIAINHLLNYPNPSSTFTRFLLEHDRPDESLDVRVDIFSLSGHLIKTLSQTFLPNGFNNIEMNWDIDININPGIYIYKVFIKSNNDDSIGEKSEKLIIVR